MSKEIKIQFKSQFNDTDIREFVKTIETQMGKIDLSSSIKDNLLKNTKDITNILENIGSFKFTTKNKGDFDTLVDSMENKIAEVKTQLDTINKTDFKINVSNDQIVTTKKTIDDLKRALGELQEDFSVRFKKVAQDFDLSKQFQKAIGSADDLNKVIANQKKEMASATSFSEMGAENFTKYEKFYKDIKNTREEAELLGYVLQDSMNFTNKGKNKEANAFGFPTYTDLRNTTKAMETALKLEEISTIKAQEKQATYQKNLNTLNAIKQTLDSQPKAAQELNDEIKKTEESLKNMSAAAEGKILEKQFGEITPISQKLNDAGNSMKALKTDSENLAVSINKAIGQDMSQKVSTFALKWFGVEKAIQVTTKTIKSAFDTYRQLDTKIAGIAMVTGSSLKSVWSEVGGYTELARELGTTTKSIATMSEEFYRQGLNHADTMKMIEGTTKMASIANMDFGVAVNYMTAAINGFKLEASDALMVSDIFSKLDAVAAVSVEGLAVALSKTASIAKSAGMEIETTTAFLTKMIETTQEAPENIGTAMKSIIARMQELKEAPMTLLEDGASANKVEDALKTAQVALRDTAGEFRDLDEVLLELNSKWDGLDRNTQRYIATMVAGNRQQSRFIALMDGYARTQELVEYANNSAGTSTTAFQKKLESLDTAINKIAVSWESFYLSEDLIVMFTSGATALANFIQTFADLGVVGTAFVAILGFMIAKYALTILSARLAATAIGKLGTEQAKTAAETMLNNTAMTGQIGLVKALTASFTKLNIIQQGSDVSKTIGGATSSFSAIGATLAAAGPTIGIIAVALLAVGTAIYFITKQSRDLRKFREELQKTQAASETSAKEAKDVEALVDKYEKLNKIYAKTEEEKEALHTVTEDLLGIYPELLDYYDEEGNAILKMNGELQELIRLKKEAAAQDKLTTLSVALQGASKGQDAETLKIEEQSKKMTDAYREKAIKEGFKYKQAINANGEMKSYAYNQEGADKFFENPENQWMLRDGDRGAKRSSSNAILAYNLDSDPNFLRQAQALSSGTDILEELARQQEVETNEMQKRISQGRANQINAWSGALVENIKYSGIYGAEEMDEAQTEAMQKIVGAMFNKDYSALLGENGEETDESKNFLKQFSENNIAALSTEAVSLINDSMSSLPPSSAIDFNNLLSNTKTLSAQEFRTAIENSGYDSALKEALEMTYAKIEQDNTRRMKQLSGLLNGDVDLMGQLSQISMEDSSKLTNLPNQLQQIDNPANRLIVAQGLIDLMRESTKQAESANIDTNLIETIVGNINPADVGSIASARYEIAKLLNLPVESEQMSAMFDNIAIAAKAATIGTEEVLTRVQNFSKNQNSFSDWSEKNAEGKLETGDVTRMQYLMPEINLEDFKFDEISGGFRLITSNVEEFHKKWVEGERVGIEANLKTAQAVKDATIAQYGNIDSLRTLQSVMAATGTNSPMAAMLQEQIRDFDNANIAITEYSTLLAAIPEVSTSTAQFSGAVNDLQGYVSQMEVLVAVAEEQETNNQISLNTMSELIGMNAEYADMLTIQNGVITVNTDLLAERSAAMENDAKASIRSRIAVLQAEIAIDQAKIDSFENIRKLMEENGEISVKQVQEILTKEAAVVKAGEQAKLDIITESEEGKVNITNNAASALAATMAKTVLNSATYAAAIISDNNLIGESYQNAAQAAASGVAKAVNYTSAAGAINSDFAQIELEKKELTDRAQEITQNVNDAYAAAGEAGANAYINGEKKVFEDANATRQATVARLEGLVNADWNTTFAKTGGSLSSKGGSEKKEKEAKEYETSLEAVHNTLQKIKAVQEEIERLEHAAFMTKNGYEAQKFIESELKQIEEEIKLNKEASQIQTEQMAQLRAQLLAQHEQFVSFVGDMLMINYNAIQEAIKSGSLDEKGLQGLEKLIGGYTKLQDSVNGYKKSIRSLEKQRAEIERKRKQQVFDMENKLLHALISRDEKELKALREKYEKMKQLDIDYLEAVKKAREKEKQLRDNVNDEKDLSRMRERLSLLERDTSQAHMKEIKELREQIAEKELEISDKRKDQIIADMEEEHEKAQKGYDDDIKAAEDAHEKKLEDYSIYWAEVEAIMNRGADAMLDVLMEYDSEFLKMSNRQKEQWIEDMRKAAQEVESIMKGLGSGINSDDGGEGLDQSPNVVNNSGTVKPKPTTKPPTSSGNSGNFSGPIYSSASGAASGKGGVKALYGSGPYTIIKEVGDAYQVRYHKLKSGTSGYFPKSKRYKHGGMVDYTGPAWVDGTNTRPEAFLDADDTEAMRNLLNALKVTVNKNINNNDNIKSQAPIENKIFFELYPELHDKYDTEQMIEDALDKITKETDNSTVFKVKR